MSVLEPPDSDQCSDDTTETTPGSPPYYSCDDVQTCRPALPRIKSCLKSSPSSSGTSTPSSSGSVHPHAKKHVAFCEDGTEEVYEADEWDRTPAEVTQRLSYEDVLELKMLQRELPRAEQPVDVLSSKPFANVFLSHVPIPLLPLNPTTESATSSPSATPPRVMSRPSSPRELSRDSCPTRGFNPPYPALPPHSSPCSHTSQHTIPAQTRALHPDSHKPPSEPSIIRPHNVPVPPPPVPPRTTHAPPPSSTTQVKSNLPPPKRIFSFVPLLDESSHSRSVSRTPTPTPSAAATPSGTASPLLGSPVSTPVPLALAEALSASSSTTSVSSRSSQTSHGSDPDRFDIGYVSDCSITEASTPSLTTASLASSPPESPGMESHCFSDHERFGRHRRIHGEDDDESFVLNLDMDADVDPVDSYFPRMHPLPQPGLGDQTKTFVSRVPVSPFHARHPHLNRPNFAPSSSAPAPNGHAIGGDAPHSSAFDPLYKLRLNAVPSPDLDVPSPLELPGPGNGRGAAGGAGDPLPQRKIRLALLPLADSSHDVESGILLAPEDPVIPPSPARC
ncbi:hypothetical protein ID866_5635 [Astraeus odoratus]|nr:hypothetical protein ID866_5635 [Astraeus odoratus]